MNLFDKIVYDLFFKENSNEKIKGENVDSKSNTMESLINHQSHKKNKGYVIFISLTITFLTLSMFAIIYSMFLYYEVHTYKPVDLFDDYTYSSNNPYIENYTLNGQEHIFRVKISHNAIKDSGKGYIVNHSAFLYLDDSLLVEDNPTFNGFISSYYTEKVDRYDKNEFDNKNYEYTYSVSINILKDLIGREYAVISFVPKNVDDYGNLYLLVINENNELIYNTMGVSKVYRGLEKNEDNAFGDEGFVSIENNKVSYVSYFDGNLAHVNEVTINGNSVVETEVETFTAITG